MVGRDTDQSFQFCKVNLATPKVAREETRRVLRPKPERTFWQTASSTTDRRSSVQVASLQRMRTNGQKFYLEVAWAHEVVLTVGVESLREKYPDARMEALRQG